MKHFVSDHAWLKQNGLEHADAIRFEDEVLDQIPEGQPVGSLSSVSR